MTHQFHTTHPSGSTHVNDWHPKLFPFKVLENVLVLRRESRVVEETHSVVPPVHHLQMVRLVWYRLVVKNPKRVVPGISDDVDLHDEEDVPDEVPAEWFPPPAEHVDYVAANVVALVDLQQHVLVKLVRAEEDGVGREVVLDLVVEVLEVLVLDVAGGDVEEYDGDVVLDELAQEQLQEVDT
jgi:hypothetical protein